MKKIVLLLLLPPLFGSAQHHDFKSETRWSFEYKEQVLNYFGGRLKMKGTFVIYTTETEKLAMPVGRHVFYRRNGKKRNVMMYSNDGRHDYDSLFDKKGALKKTILYEQQKNETKKDDAYRPYQIKLIPFD